MINRIVLVGRLTRDPELKKTTKNNVAVVSFTIAVDNRFKSPTGEKSTSFIPCIVWKETAENVAKFTHKGSLVGVEGRLVQRSYESKEGKNVQVFEVVCDTVQFLEPKGSNTHNVSEPPLMDAPEDENKNLSSVDIEDDLPF